MIVNGNLAAFLQMISVAEGTADIPGGDGGYRVIVGSTPKAPILFYSYADHPRRVIRINASLTSSAAGKFQILARIYDAYRTRLHLPDFSPASQDAIALQLIGECHALDDINQGRFDAAVQKCRSRWASLPNANYPGQRMSRLADLEHAYLRAGGKVA